MVNKKKQWEEMWERYDEADEGVRGVVAALNLLGINTSASCEGHMEHGIAAPWVDVIAHMDENLAVLNKKADDLQRSAEELFKIMEQHEARAVLSEFEELRDQILFKNLQETLKLQDLLEEYYKKRSVKYRVKLVLNVYGRGHTRLISQGGMYQEAYAEKDQAVNLAEYQQEMKEFGEFLKEKWLGK